jgi:predicted nucleotidyltransferase
MSREDAARLAARLLYDRKYKEYKEAKEVAAVSLGSEALPSNYEVAVELDALTDRLEGEARQKRLTEMREAALQVMKKLTRYRPRLMGSVWRGTIRLGSDIDIIVYGDPDEVEHDISQSHAMIGIEKRRFTLNGLPRETTHINITVNGYETEVVVRPPGDMEAYREERCETYGDHRRGLGVPELEKLMKTDPLRRFVPRRRPK